MNQPAITVDFSQSIIGRLNMLEMEISDKRTYQPQDFITRYQLLYSYFIELSQFMDEDTKTIFRRGLSQITKEAQQQNSKSARKFLNHYDDLDITLRKWKEENKAKLVKR